MSFGRFVYWCAICGGWAAVFGWALGRTLAQGETVGGTGIKGLCLGMLIALALGLVDALWIYALRSSWRAAPRVAMCVAVGAVGGLVGGVIGQALFDVF